MATYDCPDCEFAEYDPAKVDCDSSGQDMVYRCPNCNATIETIQGEGDASSEHVSSVSKRL